MDPLSLSSLFLNEKFGKETFQIKYSKAYYGNVCSLCFISEGLKKCASCKTISYCSRDHQVEDWTFHRLFCSVLKLACNNEVPMNSFVEFTTYRKNIALKLNENLKAQLIASFPTFERFVWQVSEFPWVCSVCFSKDSLKYECDTCQSVVYCSLEHKKADEELHKPSCNSLKLCKLFDSLPYSKGFNLIKSNNKFNKVPQTVKKLPLNMNELSFLLLKQSTHSDDVHELMNFMMHNDVYATAATILYGLEKIGLIQDRVLTSKPSLTEEERESRLAERAVQVLMKRLSGEDECVDVDVNPCFVIHFVGASEYEASFQWVIIIGVLTHWMNNVDYVKAALIGPDLNNCCEPDFSNLGARSEYKCFPRFYKDVVQQLPKPDLIVLYDYGLDKKASEEFDDVESQRTLFNHWKVPVLITSSLETKLVDLVNKLSFPSNVKIQLSPQKNPFSESRPHRIWNEPTISTFVRNQYISVLSRQ